MEIKIRAIQMGNQYDRFIVNEYGTSDGEIFHRYIVITRDIYDAFQRDPDNDMLLDTFLKRHDINSEWTRVTKDELGNLTRLLEDTNLENKQDEIDEFNDEAKRKIYNKVYSALSEKETLVADPFIMDVFNEALRDDSDLSDWESIFPFFR